MVWKRIAGAGFATMAGVGLLIAAVNPANAAGEYPAKAFALQVEAAGHTVLEPTPYVESPDGELTKKRTVSIPARDNNPTLSLPVSNSAPMDVGVLEALAEKNHAEARVAALSLGGNGGVTAKAVESTCKKAEGSTRIINLELSNNELSGLVANPEANTKIGVPGVVEITLNEQTVNDDGSLTVNAVHVEVAPDLTPVQLNQVSTALSDAGGLNVGAGMTPLSDLTGQLQGGVQSNLRDAKVKQAESEALVDVIVASATCGDKTHDDGDDEDPPNDGGSAPTPTPVETNHAVTG